MPGAQAVPNAKIRNSLRRMFQHSALYAFGNIAGRVVGFLAIPFYSRFLSPAQYGLIELIELSTQTVAIAFGLQAIGTALTRLYHDQASPEAERSVVSTALIGTALLSAGVTACKRRRLRGDQPRGVPHRCVDHAAAGGLRRHVLRQHDRGRAGL